MDEESVHSYALNRSQLFLLRVWYEERTPRVREVRVQLRHVLSGEVHYFRDWSALQRHIAARFESSDTTPPE